MKHVMINSKSKKVIESNKAIYKQKLQESMGTFNMSNFRNNDFTSDPGEGSRHKEIIGILESK